jgi:DNA invertase Pin-like site-specific DNA recombinase
MNAESKVTLEHLQRSAYLYIRQSTLRQVMENTESTQRQYDLRRRAVALGWSEEQIIVIDHDQGHSGASTADREGFQRLVADVGLGKAGIVMGLEVSRLARNCADWHRLLEICGLTRTLILDDEGLYDPGHFNDRLLLGLKGTMSEAELHVLKARLVGGRMSKAQRGELRVLLPIGLVYDDLDRVCLDPDQQVQNTLKMFFETFGRIGSAWKTVQEFGRLGLKFPARRPRGSGELVWQELTLATALAALHNPRYAGVFCYGRTRTWKNLEGQQRSQRVPQEKWRFFKANAHPGYITWEKFQENQQRLRQNYQAYGGEKTTNRTAGPAREGPGLLQGLVLCGQCGRSMILRYESKNGRTKPLYVCERASIAQCRPVCQRVPGTGVDEAIGNVLLESVSPLALEVALHVQAEVQARIAEADRIRKQHVERAQYEADQAKLRYMKVDPNNRLVAHTLEANWNEKLRAVAQAKEEYEKLHAQDNAQLSAEQKAKIVGLASNFPKLWRDPNTLNRDRKRMVRLLVEDVTLKRSEDISVQIRFKGGATREMHLPMPQPAWALRKTPAPIIRLIDELLEEHPYPEVARELNARGLRSGVGKSFTSERVKHLQKDYHLKSRQARLCEKGWLTAAQVAEVIEEDPHRVYQWCSKGLLEGLRCSERNNQMYRRPSEATIAEIKRRKRPAARKKLADVQADESRAV